MNMAVHHNQYMYLYIYLFKVTLYNETMISSAICINYIQTLAPLLGTLWNAS